MITDDDIFKMSRAEIVFWFVWRAIMVSISVSSNSHASTLEQSPEHSVFFREFIPPSSFYLFPNTCHRVILPHHHTSAQSLSRHILETRRC